MYERMLDKQTPPSWEEFTAYCGENQGRLLQLHGFLTQTLGLLAQLRFPYGNSYGWAMNYAKKSKHVCDVFAEQGAFTVMLRLSGAQLVACKAGVSPHGQTLIDGCYPCGDGGWLHYRVLQPDHLADVVQMLGTKCQKPQKPRADKP